MYDLDKDIIKILAERKTNIQIISILVGLYITYVILKFIIPIKIIPFILLPILIFSFILLIKINKSDEEKLKQLIITLKRHNINTPDKIELLINQNQQRMHTPSALNISSFLISIVAIIISLTENPKEQFQIFIIYTIEMIILGISFVMYYKLLSNYQNYYKLNNMLCYIYINYEKYFSSNNKVNKKSSTLKNILLSIIENILK